jgi:hypothetical protein
MARFDTTRCCECRGPLSRYDIEVTGEDTCKTCRYDECLDEQEVLKPCGCNFTQQCDNCCPSELPECHANY